MHQVLFPFNRIIQNSVMSPTTDEIRIIKACSHKLSWYFVLMLVMCLSSVHVALKGDPTLWWGVGLFGVGIAVFYIAMNKPDGHMHLKLDSEAMEIKSLYSSKRFRWVDIRSIDLKIFRYKYSRVTVINFVFHPHIARQMPLHMLGGGTISNMYELPLPELLEVLKTWHAKYGKTRILPMSPPDQSLPKPHFL